MSANGRKHRALVRHGDEDTLLKAAEILEMLDRGMPLAEIDVPPGITIEPTQAEFEASCREIGIEPPPWPLPEGGWIGPIFLMAVERLRKLEPPFCWQSKEALRRIREHLDGDSLLPFALGAYVALTENASDKRAEEFTTLQSHLCRLAGGFSTKTLQRVLPILREIGVIDYTTPRLRGPITFRLVPVATDSPNVATDSPNVATTKKTAFQSPNRITIEEQEKNIEKNTLAQPAAGAVERSASVLSDAQDLGFAVFWKAYPKRRGKLAAQKAWKKLKPPLAKVLETLSVITASREWRRDNGQFIPYPASWLNDGRWDDELPARRNRDIL